jgi:isoamylase
MTGYSLMEDIPSSLHALRGGEIGRTQEGNDNAFCQDNALSWFDRKHVDTELLGSVTRLVRLRLDRVVFRRRRFFHGGPVRGASSQPSPGAAPERR